MAAVGLSYLSNESQEYVEAVLCESELKVDVKKASLLREYGKNSVYRVNPEMAAVSTAPTESTFG